MSNNIHADLMDLVKGRSNPSGLEILEAMKITPKTNPCDKVKGSIREVLKLLDQSVPLAEAVIQVMPKTLAKTKGKAIQPPGESANQMPGNAGQALHEFGKTVGEKDADRLVETIGQSTIDARDMAGNVSCQNYMDGYFEGLGQAVLSPEFTKKVEERVKKLESEAERK